MSTQYAQPAQYGSNIYPGNAYPTNNGFVQSSAPGFAFKKRFERVDWKKIANADVDAISRNLDFRSLQDNITNVTFCNLESEIDTRMIEPNFIKLFKLAQLTIEYLLHSQDYLSTLVVALEDKLKKALDEHGETKKHLEKTKDEMAEVKKESHKRKKMLMAQQQILQAGTNSYNKCPFCSKAFVNTTFLQSHLQRRHTEFLGSYNSMTAAQVQQAAQPQQAPPLISPPQPQLIKSAAKSTTSVDLENELHEIKDRLKLTESQLVEERNARNMISQRDKEDDANLDREMQEKMHKWQKKQEDQHKRETDQLRDMFLQQLKELTQKYECSQEMLADLQHKHSKSSNLGMIEDDIDNERDLLQKQREDVAMLKEQLEQQMEQSMELKLAEQDAKWKRRVKSMEKENKRQLSELSSNVQTTVEELHLERGSQLSLEAQYKEQIERMEDNQRKEELTRMEEQEENARKNKEQSEKLAKEKAEREKAAAAAATKQQVDTHVVKATGVGGAMYDDDDDDDDGSEEEEEESETEAGQTTEFDGTSTFTTTRGTLSMGQFGTSLSMTEPPSERLMEELKRNPHLLKPLREQVRSTLEQELLKRGIPENAKGLTDVICNNKLQLLKNERQQLAKKYRNIFDIRQSYINLVEQQAKDKMKELYQKEVPSKLRYQPIHTGSSTAGQSVAPPVHSPVRTRSQSRDRVDQPKRPKSHPPIPAPRATSPMGRHSMPGTISTYGGGQTRSSVGSSMATTAASSTWDDDDEEDDDESTLDEVDGHPVQQKRAPPTQQRQQMVKNTRFADDNEDDDDEGTEEESDEDDSNWDAISDLEGDLEPTPGRAPRSKALTPQPRGQNVAQLSRKIERQLSGRKHDKKPAGGIDTMKMEENEKPMTKAKPMSYEDEDDSLASLSSYEDEKPIGPQPVTRRVTTPQTRSSATDYETNTYGTSVWGSSSKGGRSSHPTSASHNNTSKTSEGVDSDDWGSDNLDL